MLACLSRLRRQTDGLAALFIAVCASSPAVALRPDDVAVLYDLASDQFAVRQRMTQRLLADERLDQGDIAQLYTKAHAPEQRHRLLNVARHHAVQEMRQRMFDDQEGSAAIGVRHSAFSAGQIPELDQPGLIIVETFPGFPGHAHLRRGDMILKIDGRAFPADLSTGKTAELFVRIVQEHRAGQSIHLDVHRNGRTVNIQFQLASLSALRAMYKDAQNLQQPFLEQWLSVRHKLVHQQPAIPVLSEAAPPPLVEDVSGTPDRDGPQKTPQRP